MVKKISVVIPTLQKNTTLLFKLLDNLSKDDGVGEIIVIDNSTKGLDYNCEKLKLISPKENMFVNPSWNLGVKEAKYKIVALLNDDIIVPERFCSSVAKKMNSNMGCIGCSRRFIREINDYDVVPEKKEIELTEISFRNLHWGIAIFFYKTSYYDIPENLKIYCGDDWLIYKNNKAKRKNYCIQNQIIHHYGSLSSGSVEFNRVLHDEEKIYRKLTFSFIENIFSYKRDFSGFRLNLLGLKFSKKFSE
ncbi:MAG: glycosyltransferase [Cyanobacteria bacterium SIG31]|nr:glycosyltransferase [Cyanobacteria bacterium SIG31]